MLKLVKIVKIETFKKLVDNYFNDIFIKKTLEFISDNRSFILAISVNALAFVLSIWWLLDSNWNTKKPIEIEPIVSSFSLLATFLALVFVNDKLSKPKLKIKLSGSATAPTNGDEQQIGMNVSVQNHSIIKVFIKQFYIELLNTEMNLHLLHEGFTGIPLTKVILEPGQEFSLNIVKKDLLHNGDFNINNFGAFVVETDIGHKFIVLKNEVQENLKFLEIQI